MAWQSPRQPIRCRTRPTPDNLSVCESKQTVAAVWRPCPSRDTARFTQPGRSRCRDRHPAKQSWVSGRSAVRVQLWERRLSGSARRTQVAADARDSRHPPFEPDDVAHRAAAVSPQTRTRLASPRRANRVLCFFAANLGGRGSGQAANWNNRLSKSSALAASAETGCYSLQTGLTAAIGADTLPMVGRIRPHRIRALRPVRIRVLY
jgi:hypothetical protein